ncbi:MAG TPA: FtsX-like permease family protein, partial [Dehalococcoidia bacterium]|nr:FtsX-like permease family protein [Dehalococcoidia bacterium]
MEALFGIPMNTIMLVLLALFGVALASVALIFFRSGVMFRMGLRNIPRRGAQSGLVIVGLMLATLITTAAFTTGDTIDHSIKRVGYATLQRIDLSLNLLGEDVAVSTDNAVYFNDTTAQGLEGQFAGDPDIEGFIPLLLEPVPAINERSKQSEPAITLSGVDPERMTALGGLRLSSGGKADLSKLGPNDIYLSKRAADKLNARTGDQITVHAGGSTASVSVIGIIEDELAASGSAAFFEKGSGGGAMLLSSVQKLTGHTGEINFLGVALNGGLSASRQRSDSAISRLEPFLQSDAGRQLLGVNNTVSVEATKADEIENAEDVGNLFTTFFLVLGLFSIAAGIMLIFMIFVMLATERKPEMGMARAVGAQRSSLVQAFLSEGMAYSVLAGGVGALVGMAAAIGLVVGFLKISGGFDFIQAHITVRSLVISYCLGVVVTFITVVFSSISVSSVNIVAAIRGTEEDDRHEARRKISWRWMLAGLPAMVVPPLGIWFFFRKGLGMAWAWIIAPIGIVLGVFSILLANSGESEFLFSFGVSVLPLCFAMIASRLRAPARLTWTLVGAYLAAYWLAPVDYAKLILGKHLSGDIEMFVLSGVMVVIGSTLVIVYNARLLTVIFQQRGSGPRYAATVVMTALTVACFAVGYAMGDRYDGTGELLYLFGGVLAIGAAVAFAAVRFPHTAPALKMGVAYPLSNRFRTGMAIAMFSLIVFSLATFGAVNASFVSLLTAEGGDGGWDAIATATRNTENPDVEAALAAVQAPVASDIAAVGRVSTYTGTSQARVPGTGYKAFPVIAADEAFLAMNDARLGSWVDGYESEADVFAAVAADARLALVDPSVLPSGFNEFEFTLDDLKVTDDRFEPFDLEYTDVTTGREARVTVVGVLAIQVGPSYTSGIYVNEAAYEATFGEPEFLRNYVKFDDGVKVKAAAESIEASLVTEGVQVETTKSLLDATVAESNTFVRMFQGFMALGLLTGIAALGVIAYRSVTERRQQIGMLRAIGYQSGSIALTFMLESGFIALMGILSGVVGGMIIARNLFTSGQFSGEGIEFAIPWTEVLIIVVTAFVFSM